MSGMGMAQKGEERHDSEGVTLLWLEQRVALLVLYRGIHPVSLPPPSKLTMVLLVTSDNEQFVVEKDVAERSVLIKNMLEGIYFPPYPCSSDANMTL
jgi:hypothetical protein